MEEEKRKKERKKERKKKEKEVKRTRDALNRKLKPRIKINKAKILTHCVYFWKFVLLVFLSNFSYNFKRFGGIS